MFPWYSANRGTETPDPWTVICYELVSAAEPRSDENTFRRPIASSSALPYVDATAAVRTALPARSSSYPAIPTNGFAPNDAAPRRRGPRSANLARLSSAGTATGPFRILPIESGYIAPKSAPGQPYLNSLAFIFWRTPSAYVPARSRSIRGASRPIENHPGCNGCARGGYLGLTNSSN